MLLFLANTISGFAQGISMIAIPWYFTEVLQLPSVFGIAYAVVTFFTIFWSLYSGTLIDRYDRKMVFLLLNVAGFFILGSVSLTGFILGYLPVALIIFVFAATLFIFHLHYPSLYAFGQEITLPKNYGRMNSLIEVVGQFTSVLAGAIAAILLSGNLTGTVEIIGMNLPLPIKFASFSLTEIFLIDCLTYFVSIFLIAAIKYTPAVKRTIERGHIFTRLVNGWKYLKERPALLIFGIFSHNVFIVVMILIFFQLPVYISNYLGEGPEVYGSGQVLYATGALLAGFGIRHLFRKIPVAGAIIINLMVTAGIMFLFALTKNLWLFFPGMLLLGVMNAGTRIMRITYLFNHISNDVIGRVNGVFSVVNIIGRVAFISLFSIPFFSRGDNVVYVFFIFGIFTFASAIPLILNYKKLDRS